MPDYAFHNYYDHDETGQAASSFLGMMLISKRRSLEFHLDTTTCIDNTKETKHYHGWGFENATDIPAITGRYIGNHSNRLRSSWTDSATLIGFGGFFVILILDFLDSSHSLTVRFPLETGIFQPSLVLIRLFFSFSDPRCQEQLWSLSVFSFPCSIS